MRFKYTLLVLAVIALCVCLLTVGSLQAEQCPTPPGLADHNGPQRWKFGTHEVGHIMGLGHQPDPQVDHFSIMNKGRGPNDAGNGTPSVSAGRLPWNPIKQTNCDNFGVGCWDCATPTPPPSDQCYWTSGDTEYVYAGTCWYWWTPWYYICNGAITDYDEEWELDYCEEQ